MALAAVSLITMPGAAGATLPIGSQFRISYIGTDGDNGRRAEYPDVAYSSRSDRYLVVWDADGTVTENELEIFGRIYNGQGEAIGPHFRISDMGPDGETIYDAKSPAVAYNSTSDEFLVVWDGDDGAPNNELEIYGQRVSVDGAELGSNDFKITDMGGVGDASYDAIYADVTYNSTSDEYLVVWEGNDGPPLADNEQEIYGQRLSASGAEAGTNDFRISDMGADGEAAYDAERPAATFNSSANEYLVVWEGENGVPLAEDEYEIYGQLLAASGAEAGTNDFRISTMGPDGDASYDGRNPAVAYNSASNEYLAVWYADAEAPLADDELEIYGQRISASGSELGTDDFRMSDTGDDGDTNYDAYDPDITYNHRADEYLAVWNSDDGGPVLESENEIFGQRLDGDGSETGTNDFRISTMGPDGSADYDALNVAVAYNSSTNEYLPVWQGEDNSGDLVVSEYEIYGRRSGAGDLPPTADTTAPKLKLHMKKIKLGRRARLKGARLRLRIWCDEACNVNYKAKLKAKGARGLPKLLGGIVPVSANQERKVTLKIGKKKVRRMLRALRRMKRKRRKGLRLIVTARAQDAAGNSTRKTLRRRVNVRSSLI